MIGTQQLLQLDGGKADPLTAHPLVGHGAEAPQKPGKSPLGALGGRCGAAWCVLQPYRCTMRSGQGGVASLPAHPTAGRRDDGAGAAEIALPGILSREFDQIRWDIAV